MNGTFSFLDVAKVLVEERNEHARRQRELQRAMSQQRARNRVRRSIQRGLKNGLTRSDIEDEFSVTLRHASDN